MIDWLIAHILIVALIMYIVSVVGFAAYLGVHLARLVRIVNGGPKKLRGMFGTTNTIINSKGCSINKFADNRVAGKEKRDD